MRVAFFGTPDVAVPPLANLLASSHDVVGVVTQPDRPRGRNREPSPSPVKALASEHGLPVLQPTSPKEDGFVDALSALAPEALAVVAYGHILPRAVLAVAPAVNVHFSLLPRYRGAAPVQRALMDGVDETGVTVFLLEPTVDTGPILAREAIRVAPEDTAGDVFEALVPIGARLLLEVLDALEAGSATPRPQADATASPAPKIKPEEAVIDWSLPAGSIVNRIRGLSPRPGAHTTFRGKRLHVRRARVGAPVDAAPGAVVDAAALAVAASDGSVVLLEVQPEGKRAMSGEEFARGYRPREGEVLGEPSDIDGSP